MISDFLPKNKKFAGFAGKNFLEKLISNSESAYPKTPRVEIYRFPKFADFLPKKFAGHVNCTSAETSFWANKFLRLQAKNASEGGTLG